MEKRLWIPDYIKGWTVIIIIQAHIFETWIQPDLIETKTGTVIRLINNIPAAPLLMLLMGYLAYYTKAGSSKLIVRGLKIMFWGLLLNIGLNLNYLIQILTNRTEGNILHSILAMDIFFLAGLSLIIIGLIRNSRHSLWISLSASVVIALSSPMVAQCLDQINPDNYLLAVLGSHADWSYFPVFPWLSYPLLGFAFSCLLSRYPLSELSKSWKILILFIALGIGSLGFIYNWNDIKNLTPYYHHGLPVYIWSNIIALGMVILLSFFPGFQRSIFSAWIQFVGKKLTRYYVIQWLIIGNLASFIYQGLGLWAYFIGFIAVSAATTTLVYLWEDKDFSFVYRKILNIFRFS